MIRVTIDYRMIRVTFDYHMIRVTMFVRRISLPVDAQLFLFGVENVCFLWFECL